jgi:hypothetical protein
MFSSSPRKLVRIEHIDAEAEALIVYFGADAYLEARRRGREASSDAIAEDWDRVALVVARKAEATKMGMHGHLRDQSEPANPEIKPQKVDQIDELKRLIGDGT